MMMSATDDTFEITKSGNVGKNKPKLPEPRSNKPKLPEPKKHVPFNKEEGVLKMIEDYNLIKQGKSKKGITKQARIKKRVDEWLKSGMLDESDL